MLVAFGETGVLRFGAAFVCFGADANGLQKIIEDFRELALGVLLHDMEVKLIALLGLEELHEGVLKEIHLAMEGFLELFSVRVHVMDFITVDEVKTADDELLFGIVGEDADDVEASTLKNAFSYARPDFD